MKRNLLILGVIVVVVGIVLALSAKSSLFQGFNRLDPKVKNVSASKMYEIPVPLDNNPYTTRAKLAQAIVKALEINTQPCTSSEFPDVAINNTFCPAIHALVEMGVFTPRGREFGPNARLTKAELVKILVRSFEVDDDSPRSSGYGDVDDTEWYKKSIVALEKIDVLNGSGIFNPDNLALTKFQDSLLKKLKDYYFASAEPLLIFRNLDPNSPDGSRLLLNGGDWYNDEGSLILSGDEVLIKLDSVVHGSDGSLGSANFTFMDISGMRSQELQLSQRIRLFAGGHYNNVYYVTLKEIGRELSEDNVLIEIIKK
ncbi:S-layer homology domain-containing protein [Candidatus Peregrinibacteria bacterium]|nr:S-layer homology domain-containing protein [Candidatus Peregrinibacteria bacterium]